jgi:hypothetical protein
MIYIKIIVIFSLCTLSLNPVMSKLYFTLLIFGVFLRNLVKNILSRNRRVGNSDIGTSDPTSKIKIDPSINLPLSVYYGEYQGVAFPVDFDSSGFITIQAERLCCEEYGVEVKESKNVTSSSTLISHEIFSFKNDSNSGVILTLYYNNGGVLRILAYTRIILCDFHHPVLCNIRGKTMVFTS